MAEARRRLTVLALGRLDELTGDERFAPEVAMRIRVGYESQLARIERRLEVLRSGVSEQEEGEGGADGHVGGHLQAEGDLRKLVINSERTELSRLVARRKVSERVADEVRAALDVDEITMRP